MPVPLNPNLEVPLTTATITDSPREARDTSGAVPRVPRAVPLFELGTPVAPFPQLSAKFTQHVVLFFRPRKMALGLPGAGVAMGRGRFRSSARKLATQIALGCAEHTNGETSLALTRATVAAAARRGVGKPSPVNRQKDTQGPGDARLWLVPALAACLVPVQGMEFQPPRASPESAPFRL